MHFPGHSQEDEERRDLLLYLLSGVPSVSPAPKIQAIMNLLNRDFDISDKYRFRRQFLARTDTELESDILKLDLQKFVGYEPAGKDAGGRMMKITPSGIRYLDFFGTGKTLGKRLGAKLDEIEDMFFVYNSMDFGELLVLQNSPEAPINRGKAY